MIVPAGAFEYVVSLHPPLMITEIGTNIRVGSCPGGSWCNKQVECLFDVEPLLTVPACR